MLRSAIQIGAIVCVSSVVQAGVVVELVPDNPGPYFGGESLTVDVWLQSEEPSDVELRTVSFDFSETDSELTLDSTFEFDLSSVTSGAVYSVFPEFPRPGIAFTPDIGTPPGFLLVLPAIDPLHIGSVGLVLPSMPGVYRVDTLNADEPDLGLGGARFTLGSGTSWRAYDGEITGGTFDFAVIPEPGTLSLLVLGCVAFMTRARRRRPEDRARGRAPTGRSPKMSTPVAAFICTVGVCLSAVVQGGVVIELVPDNAGPYLGGESMTVDVWIDSEVSWAVLLRKIQFDFSESDPALDLDSTFAFNFSALPGGVGGYAPFLHPELPVPNAFQGLDCDCPFRYFQLPGDGSLLIGSIGVELPSAPGSYRIDLLNADESDELFGAAIRTEWSLPEFPPPSFDWRAFTGDITGGAHEFVVIPEPATGMLLFAGMLGILSVFRRRCGRHGVGGALVLVGVLACVGRASAQPLPVSTANVPAARALHPG